MQPEVAPYIRSLIPYVPGKPIEETKREFGIKRVVKLASNENPLGPSPKAIIAAKKALEEMNRYPDASAFSLKKALSDRLRVNLDQIIVGNGSEEIIDNTIQAYCIPGDSIVTSASAFLKYKVGAQIRGVRTLESPLAPGLRFDLEAMLKLIKNDDRAKIVFIPNPNNPTGTYLSEAELRSFLKEVNRVRSGEIITVLDYAYWEYTTEPDLPNPFSLMKDFENVIVLQTFSKVYGLSGLRVGYGVGPSNLVQNVDRVKLVFNTNSIALAAAEAALKDGAFLKRAIAENRAAMKFWEKALTEMGIPFWKSQGNFILADVNVGLGIDGPTTYDRCLKAGVILRPVVNYGFPNAIRISMGTRSENEIAVRVLQNLSPKGRSRTPVRNLTEKKRKK